MAVRRLAEVQPEGFAFTPDNQALCEREIAKYPEGRQASAIINLLWRAQRQHDGWLPKPAIEKVADMLGMPYIRALEIATFYSMFNLEPVGKYFIQMCGTTPCQLRGSDTIKAVCETRIGPHHHVTADGLFSWLEVECLGACCNAPMVQINEDYFEDLTEETFSKLLDDLAAGRPVTVGSQTGRSTSEPAGGLTTLTSLYGVDGRGGSGAAAGGDASRPSPQDGGRAAEEKASQDSEGAQRTTQDTLNQIDQQTPGRPPNSQPRTGGRTEVAPTSHSETKGPQGVGTPGTGGKGEG